MATIFFKHQSSVSGGEEVAVLQRLALSVKQAKQRINRNIILL